MRLGRCITEKPDVADVINWCQEYTRNNPEQRLAKKTIMEAMAKESVRRDTKVPNGSSRLRTLFSNGMITMKKRGPFQLHNGWLTRHRESSSEIN